MLKIYECIPEVYINNEWQPTTLWSQTRVLDTVPSEEIWFYTFSDLITACEKKIITNAGVIQSLFRHKTICKISVVWRDFPYKITEKNFRTVGFRWRYEEKKNVSIEYLMKHLPAEDFVKWVFEKNISINFEKTLDKQPKV